MKKTITTMRFALIGLLTFTNFVANSQTELKQPNNFQVLTPAFHKQLEDYSSFFKPWNPRDNQEFLPIANKSALANCTDKLNYCGNNVQYNIKLNGLTFNRNALLYLVAPSYVGNVIGAEVEASTYGGNPAQLVIGVYQVNASGFPFGGWLASSTVVVNSSIQTPYTVNFTIPPNITGTNGFAIGVFCPPANITDSVRLYTSGSMPFPYPNLSYTFPNNNSIQSFNNYYGLNLYMLFRPIVSTSVNTSWVSARTNTGCGAPAVYNFTNTSPNPAAYTSNTIICPGGVTKVIDYGDNTPNGNFTTLGSVRTHTYTTLGTYAAKYTQTYVGWTNNCVETITDNIVVDVPLPAFTYTVNGFTVTFNNTSSGNMSNYIWNFGDLSTSPLIQPGSHTYSSPGTYVVELEANAPCGKVRFAVSIVVPSNSTGIASANSSNKLISISPVPTSQFIKITNYGLENIDQKIEIYSSTGALVKSIKSPNLSSGKPVDIEVSDLPAGAYFIKLKHNNSDVIKSFIKE